MKHLLALVLVVVVFAEWRAHSQPVPYLVNYQGRLTDAAAQPLPSGTYGVEFRLWNRAVAGQAGEALVWGQRYDVSLVNGVFNVILGAPGGAPLSGAAVNDLQFAFGDADRYLGLTLTRLHDGTAVSDAQKQEIVPRQQLLSAPFALKADVAARLVRSAAEELVPPGTIVAFGGSAEPPGWLLCDGRAMKAAEQPRLWAAIGTAWGNPGEGQFRLPDLRGLFLRGVDNSPNTGVSGRDPEHDGGRGALHPGGNPGNAVGSFQGDVFAAHGHEYWVGGNAWVLATIPSPLDERFLTIFGHPNSPDPRQRRSFGIEATGGHETRPKNAYVNYLIKQ